MKKQKYFIKNEDNEWQEVSEDIANDIIRQYVEKKYIGVLILSSFIVGMLLGIIATS